MSGILGTALSGLMAFQRAMDTTSHNVANVNTEGYSRQSVDLSSNAAYFLGSNYVGQGVNVAGITRHYDQFVGNQLTSSSTAYGESSTLASLASQVDGVVSSDATSLAPALKSFFSAVNGVATNPTSIPSRQVLTTESASLSHQFNIMSDNFDQLRNQANGQMQGTVDDINQYAENIANLNGQISLSSNRSDALPNDLLDQRDTLINNLAQKISISSSIQPDGSVNVFVGKGQSLVLGTNKNTMSLADSDVDPSHKEIVLGGQPITQDVTGGELSGILKFRDQVLDPAQQKLGQVAAGVAIQFNKIHSTGFDMNGDAGSDMFSFGSPTLNVPVVAKPDSVGSVTAAYDPTTVGQLTPSDYELKYDGNNFSLRRLSDNNVMTFSGPPPSTIAGPGFSITTNASVAANDSFVIRPTYNAAKDMAAIISDPTKVAAAGTTGGSGLPVPGDNTVALSLAALENSPTLSGGKTTLTGAYGQMVSQVGTLTHSAKVSSSAQEVLLNQAKQARESISGVNLDEEAANLMKYQQSYQAAAQVVSVANAMFDTLIGAVRR